LQDLQGRQLHELFFPLLQEIDQVSKLTEAAQNCGLSYRHAWNILREADHFFSQPVTVMERGRGAKLSELGKVLLQANQRIQARLHTQVESLAMELNGEVHRVLADQIGVLPIYASHGYAVALIPEYLKNYQAELHYHGPLDSLRALNAGECKIAGFVISFYHNLDSVRRQYRELLNTDKVSIVQFINRQQGFMVSPKLEQDITQLTDLANSKLRFINRQPLSGTRDLFDSLLQQEKILPSSIRGYGNHEYTHSAVAAYVATGMAEIGFGVKEAAMKFNLGFIPITQDRYYWAYRTSSKNDPEVVEFITMLQDQNFQLQVNKLAGYQCNNSGEAILLSDLLS